MIRATYNINNTQQKLSYTMAVMGWIFEYSDKR